MILDLEQERKNGLDESQLAEQVMRLMNPNETCEGLAATMMTAKHWRVCSECAAAGRGLMPAHPRVPKPLREVRDELLEWLLAHDVQFKIVGIRTAGHTEIELALRLPLAVHVTEIEVAYHVITDGPLALALAAVRLLGEKQDDSPVSSMSGL